MLDPSPCSHLQIDVFDPLDDAVRRPDQRIHVLVLTLYPTGLQGLGGQDTSRRHSEALAAGAADRSGFDPGPSYLLVEMEQLQQFDAQQQADLVELLGDVEVAFEVVACERVQHAPVHQVVVEGLGVLGQAHVT